MKERGNTFLERVQQVGEAIKPQRLVERWRELSPGAKQGYCLLAGATIILATLGGIFITQDERSSIIGVLGLAGLCASFVGGSIYAEQDIRLTRLKTKAQQIQNSQRPANVVLENTDWLTL